MPTNPAASVRGPSHSVRRGKTPVLDPAEARRLLDAIDVTTPAGLRDRALIGLMVYSFARIGAALAMRVEDVFVQNRRLWVRLHEKGGKQHEMPCHHNLDEYLTAYLDGCALREDRKGPLFRTIARGTKRLSDTPLPQANAFEMYVGARSRPRSRRRSATIRSGQPGSPPILRMAVHWSAPPRWRTMLRPAPRSSMTGGRTM